jgi:hypothetical protein
MQRRIACLKDQFQINCKTTRVQRYQLTASLKAPNWPDRIPLVEIIDEDLPELAALIHELPAAFGFPQENLFFVCQEGELERLVPRLLLGLTDGSTFAEPGLIIHFGGEFLTKPERDLLLWRDVRNRYRILLTQERDTDTTALDHGWSEEFRSRIAPFVWPSIHARKHTTDVRLIFLEGVRQAVTQRGRPMPDVERSVYTLLEHIEWRSLDGARTVLEFGRTCGRLALETAKPRKLTHATAVAACVDHKLNRREPPQDERDTFRPPPPPPRTAIRGHRAGLISESGNSPLFIVS